MTQATPEARTGNVAGTSKVNHVLPLHWTFQSPRDPPCLGTVLKMTGALTWGMVNTHWPSFLELEDFCPLLTSPHTLNCQPILKSHSPLPVEISQLSELTFPFFSGTYLNPSPWFKRAPPRFCIQWGSIKSKAWSCFYLMSVVVAIMPRLAYFHSYRDAFVPECECGYAWAKSWTRYTAFSRDGF